MPDTFRRAVLYLIQDSFTRHVYGLPVDEIVEAVTASERQQQPLHAIFASRYLHDVVIRQEGLPTSPSRDTWLDVYSMTCLPGKFLDLLEHMLRTKWRGSRRIVVEINERFGEYGLPYRIKRSRIEPVVAPAALEPRRPVPLTPWTPDRNREAICSLLRSCHGRVWWLEKHMPESVIELLFVGCGLDVAEIRLLSGPANIDVPCCQRFSTFSARMADKGVDAQWRVMSRAVAAQIHDRFILTDGRAYNVPPVNSILTATQMAEIGPSSFGDSDFIAFWSGAVGIEEWARRHP